MSDAFDVAVVGGGIVGLATASALAAGRPGAPARDPGEGGAARLPPDRPQQRRHPLGDLLPPRLAQGAALRRGRPTHEGVLRGARDPRRSDRQGDRRHVASPSCRGSRRSTSAAPPTASPASRSSTATACARSSRTRAAIRAIHSPTTSIVDYGEVAQALARDLLAQGIVIRTGARVTAIEATGDGFDLATGSGPIRARHLVNCAGLYSDVVARMTGARPGVRIIPFRGEYFMVRPERHDLVRGLIYPVPDPQFPFLGVHFTRTVHGEVEAGPNAVLAFAREGYRLGRVHPRELAGTLGYRGFWAMARRYWRTGSYEMYRSAQQGGVRAGAPAARAGDHGRRRHAREARASAPRPSPRTARSSTTSGSPGPRTRSTS